MNSFLRDAKKAISTQQAETGIDYDLSQHRLDNPDEKFIKMKASSYFRWRETQGFPLDRGNNLSAYMKKFN